MNFRFPLGVSGFDGNCECLVFAFFPQRSLLGVSPEAAQWLDMKRSALLS